jgi:hypothetical protein
VPRLGLVEAIKLRIDILEAIRNCSLPKVLFDVSLFIMSGLDCRKNFKNNNYIDNVLYY